MIVFACIVLLAGGVSAQGTQPLTGAIVASIFGTIAVIAVLALVAYLIYRFCYLPKRKPNKTLTGFDNPLVIPPTDQSQRDGDPHANLSEVVVDGEAAHQAPAAQEKQKPALEGNDQNRELETIPEEVFTVLLDDKTPITNGFDVVADDDGDVVVSGVRESGPADQKLHKGDVITSVTVFFEGINYEDALNILSHAAPYKVAITATHKNKEEPETPQNVSALNKSGQHKEPNGTVSLPSGKEEVRRDSDTSSSLSDDVVTNIEQEEQDQARSRKSSSSSSSSSSSQSSDGASYDVKDENDDKNAEAKPESSVTEERNDVTKENKPLVVEEVATGQSPGIPTVNEENVTPAIASEEESKVSEMNTPEMTPSKKRDEIVFTSGWRRAVKLLDLAKARLVTESTMRKIEFGEVDIDDVANDLKLYLKGEEPIAGLLIKGSGEKMSLYDACKERIIRRGTAVSLLEAQAATGSIINPYSGKKLSVEEATKEGLIDRQFQAVLIRAERAVLGYKTKLSNEPLSLFDAMQRKLVVESHGIRLLEAQIATGGIIDPHANHRLPLDVAFERDLFDKRLHAILEDPSDDTKGFFDPNTNENLTYLELMKRCVVDESTSLLLLPFDPEKVKQ